MILLKRLLLLILISISYSNCLAQILGPECVQNGGGYECVPYENLGMPYFIGDADSLYTEAPLRDGVSRYSNKKFSSESDLRAAVDKHFSGLNFGQCTKWTDLSGGKYIPIL